MKKILIISMIAAVGAAHAQSAFSYSTGGGAALNIADGTGSNTGGAATVITLDVTDHCIITRFDVTSILGLTHSFLGDLVATISHNGNSVDLMDRNYRTTTTSFGLGNNLAGDYGFDETSAAFVSATSSAPGNYLRNDNAGFGNSAATGNYAGFVGMDVFGVWTLSISDWGGGDTGSLLGFGIAGQCVPEPATMAILGLGGLIAARRRRSK